MRVAPSVLALQIIHITKGTCTRVCRRQDMPAPSIDVAVGPEDHVLLSVDRQRAVLQQVVIRGGTQGVKGLRH